MNFGFEMDRKRNKAGVSLGSSGGGKLIVTGSRPQTSASSSSSAESKTVPDEICILKWSCHLCHGKFDCKLDYNQHLNRFHNQQPKIMAIHTLQALHTPPPPPPPPPANHPIIKIENILPKEPIPILPIAPIAVIPNSRRQHPVIIPILPRKEINNQGTAAAAAAEAASGSGGAKTLSIPLLPQTPTPLFPPSQISITKTKCDICNKNFATVREKMKHIQELHQHKKCNKVSN